ncbi:hypothetical protein AAC387_Pa01g4151 [Persea americana]
MGSPGLQLRIPSAGACECLVWCNWREIKLSFPTFIFATEDISPFHLRARLLWRFFPLSFSSISLQQFGRLGIPLSSRSLLSISARSLPLSVARRDLWKLASSTPSFVDRALSPLHSLSRRSLSLGTASSSRVVSPDFEVLSQSRRAFLPSLLLSLSHQSPPRYF